MLFRKRLQSKMRTSGHMPTVVKAFLSGFSDYISQPDSAVAAATQSMASTLSGLFLGGAGGSGGRC